MKKFFLLAAMAGVALTGCVKTESEVAVKSDSNRIVFDNPVVSSVTRALIPDAVYPMTESFSVFAQHENEGQSTLYMSDVKASYDGGTNSWIPEGNYYWPKQGTLSFAAYSPAEAKGDVFTSVTWDAASGFVISGFNAETNNDATKLYDLMYSDYAEGKTKGDQLANNPVYYGVQLKFNHALSALIFKAQTQEDYANATIKITKIEVLNPVANGNLTTVNGNPSTASWTPGTEAASMSVTGIADAALTSTSTPQGNAMLMIPQTFDGDVKVKITYTMQMDSGEPVTQTHEIVLNTLKENGTATAHADWKMATRYTYNIIIGLDKIYFAPTVTDWEDVTVTGEIE